MAYARFSHTFLRSSSDAVIPHLLAIVNASNPRRCVIFVDSWATALNVQALLEQSSDLRVSGLPYTRSQDSAYYDSVLADLGNGTLEVVVTPLSNLPCPSATVLVNYNGCSSRALYVQRSRDCPHAIDVVTYLLLSDPFFSGEYDLSSVYQPICTETGMFIIYWFTHLANCVTFLCPMCSAKLYCCCTMSPLVIT